MPDWVNLTSCFGKSIKNPSKEDLMNVLAELFSSKDDEHPDAWLHCGYDGGELHSMSVFSSGYALFTRYSDVDMTDELETREFNNVNAEKALELWSQVISGNIK